MWMLRKNLTRLMYLKKPSQATFIYECPSCQAGPFLVVGGGHHHCSQESVDPLLSRIPLFSAVPGPSAVQDANDTLTASVSLQPNEARAARAKASQNQYIRQAKGNTSFDTLPISQDASAIAFFSNIHALPLPGPRIDKRPGRTRFSNAETVGGIKTDDLQKTALPQKRRQGAWHAMHLLTHPICATVLQEALCHSAPDEPLVYLPVSSLLSEADIDEFSEDQLGYILFLSEHYVQAQRDEIVARALRKTLSDMAADFFFELQRNGRYQPIKRPTHVLAQEANLDLFRSGL